MVGGGDGLGSSRSSGLAVFALGVTLPRAVPPQTSSRGKGQKLDKNTASLGGAGLWAQGVLLTPTFSSVSAGLLSLAHDCVPRAEPGPGRELQSNKYVLDSRISPDMVLHCLQNSLPSIISSDP